MVKSQFLYFWCIKRDIELAFYFIEKCVLWNKIRSARMHSDSVWNMSASLIRITRQVSRTVHWSVDILIWGCFKIIKGNADDSVQGGMKEKTARTVRQRLRSGKFPWHCWWFPIKSSCPDWKLKKSREAGGRGAHGQQENPKSESICWKRQYWRGFGNNGQELGTKNRAASLNKTDYKEITAQPPAPEACEG